jgi:ribonuclease R
LTYDPQGNILSRSFANTVCRSSHRLTYQDADRILKGHTKAIKPQVIELLRNMETLSRLIENRRLKNGMLHLDLPETELIMDKSQRIVDASPADDSYPHTIIEMFMVEANEAVASLLDKLKVAFMRRIHPEPDSLTMKNLSKVLRAFGLSVRRTPNRTDMQNCLAAVKNTDSALAVNLVVLRSLEKAQYAPQSIGHFALASAYYCHFTSPIRRYADLLVHRVLQAYLQQGSDFTNHKPRLSREDLADIGKHITFTEQRAEDAENELKTVLVLQLLSKHIGDKIEAVVTGIAAFGVFVRSQKFGVEALIRTDDLGDDHWRFSPEEQSVVGLGSGTCIRLGEPMKVRILSVNLPARQLNVAPVEPVTRRRGSTMTEKPRRKSKDLHIRRRSKTKK